MTMKHYSGLLALLLCLGLSEQYVKDGQWSSSGSFSSSSASSSASSFSSSSSVSQSGSLAKAADLLNDIVSGGAASAHAVASANASAGATAGASAGAFASAGASASAGSKASAGAFSGNGAAGGLGSASGTNEGLSGSQLSKESAGFNGAFSSAVAGAGASNEGAGSSSEHVKGVGFDYINKGTVEVGESGAEKAVSGSFASSGAVASSGLKNVETSHVDAPTPVFFEEAKPPGGHSFTTVGTIKTTGDLHEGVGNTFIGKSEGSHYVGPFPGPKGSIYESKPVPSAKYTGPFPGPAGSIHDSKPVLHSSGTFNSAGASAAAGASAVSGTHYTGPFPGPAGSIFDSKPVPVLHTIAPLQLQGKDESLIEQTVSGGASVSSQADAAAFAKKKYQFESANDRELTGGNSFSSTQADTSSQSNEKYALSGGSISSSQAGATATNEENKYVGRYSPVLSEQPTLGTSFSSSHADAASKASAAEIKHSSEGLPAAPVSGVITLQQKPLKPVYTESFLSKDAAALSQSSAAEGQFITGGSLVAPVAPSNGVVVLEEQKPLRGIHSEAPADVVIVDHQQPKPVYGGSHTKQFDNYGSHGAKFGFGGSYGYQRAPVEQVVVLEERPRPHAVPGGQIVLVEDTPVIMSGAPAGGVFLVDDQPKPVYSPTILTTPVLEAPRRGMVIVEERPIAPSFGKPKEIVTVFPARNPSSAPVGGSCGLCSGYATGQKAFGKGFASGTSGSYKGASGNFLNSYNGGSNTESSNTRSFGAQDNTVHNSNVAGEFSTSLDNTDDQVNNYGASISEANSAAAAKAYQTSAESYGSFEKARESFGKVNEENSYKNTPVVPLVPSSHSTNFGGGEVLQNFQGDIISFHSNLKSKEEGSLGFNGNFGSALSNSASYSSNTGKAGQNAFENSHSFSDTGNVHKISENAGTYAKGSSATNSNTEGSTASFGGSASSGAFATSGSFSGSSHGLLKGLVNGLGSHKEGGNENAVAGSGSFSSGGFLPSFLGKVKGLTDGEDASGSVSRSFSSSHSSASSSAHSSSFAASSSFASSGSSGHY